MAVEASTPIELVEQVYATPPRAGRHRPRAASAGALTLTEKILINHLDDPESQELERGRSYADFHPDRVAMQDATAQMALLQFMTAGLPQVAVPSTVHCDHLIQAKAGANIDLHVRPRHQQRGLRLPVERVGQVRHRLLEAGQRHHPPGRARELRLPRRDDDRHRQPHAQRRRPRHGGHRRGRRRRRRRDDRLPVQRALAEGHRRAPDRRAERLGVAQGRHPEGRRDPHRRRAAPAPSSSTSAPAPTPSRATGKATICNMGAEIGATTLAVRLRRQHGRLPEGHRPRGHRRRRRRRRRATCGPTTRSTDRFYDQVIEIDLDELRPLINGPDTPDLAHEVSEVGAWAREPTACRSRSRPPSSARAPTRRTRTSPGPPRSPARPSAKGLTAKTQLLITPGSEQVRATIERDGLLADLEAIGGRGAGQRLRPVHRPVGPHRPRPVEGQHHRQQLQPQLPEAQRRQRQHARRS